MREAQHVLDRRDMSYYLWKVVYKDGTDTLTKDSGMRNMKILRPRPVGRKGEKKQDLTPKNINFLIVHEFLSECISLHIVSG